jgi:hypothetical protein
MLSPLEKRTLRQRPPLAPEAHLIAGRDARSCFCESKYLQMLPSEQLAHNLLLANKNFLFSAKNGLHL